jgi:hypothetical protein
MSQEQSWFACGANKGARVSFFFQLLLKKVEFVVTNLSNKCLSKPG